MHARIYNFENNEKYTDDDLFSSLQNRVDYVLEIHKHNDKEGYDWNCEIKGFTHYLTLVGVKFELIKDTLKIKVDSLKEHLLNHKYIDDKYGHLFTNKYYMTPVTEKEWIEELLYDNKGKDTITLKFNQIFDYHF